MFVAVFFCIFWGLVLPRSHLIIHLVSEWSGFQRHFWFCFGVRIHLIVFNNESVRVLVRIQQVALFYLPSIHQISTLEKTKFNQHSILSRLMRKRIHWVAPFYDAAQFASSEEIDFHVCFFFPGLSSDAVEGTSGDLSLRRETKFIIGFDFAVTLSSPESFCVLFDITSEQSVELKCLMLNKHKRWFHLSRVKFPMVSMSASWFLVSMYLIWILV